jgi:hypothetical protein
MRKGEVNINLYLRQIGRGDVDWIQIADGETWSTVMRPGPSDAIKGGERFDQLGCS